MNKGDIVTISGYAIGKRTGKNIRDAVERELPKPIQGIIIGYSFIRAGYVTPSEYNYIGEMIHEGYLEVKADHKVWLVEPLTHGNRYIKPYRCLESQIVKG